MIPAYVALRLKLRDRESELDELRQAVGAGEKKVRQAVVLGLDAVQHGTAAQLEAERLAAVAMAPEIAALESIDPQQED